MPPVVTTLLFILIFGYSLGRSISQINGFDYIVYILPGLAQNGVINNAFQNSTSSLFMARMERSIENLITSPAHYLQIVFSYILGSILRGLTVGISILVVSMIFVKFPMPHLGLLFLSWILTSALFGAIGIVAALLAETWDHVSVIGNYILLPLVYLGGTFYSISNLPHIWRQVSLFNPVYYAIDTTRYALLGVSDHSALISFSFTAFLTVIFIFISLLLFKRGFKLVG